MAKIKRKKLDAATERNLITGMIVDDRFIQDVQPILRLDLLKTPFIKIVAGWCSDYYFDFEKSPGETIENVFESKKEDLDEDLVDIIDSFLISISDEYDREKFNTSFVLSETEKYFKKRSLDVLADDIKIAVSENDITKADILRQTYKDVERPTSGITSPFSKEAVERTFNRDESTFLFSLPGALGKLVSAFCRGHFVVLSAPMKRGKSFFMIDWALRGFFRGLKVIFFSLEMVEKDINDRIYGNICGTFILETSESDSPYARERNVKIPFFDSDGDILYKSEKKKALVEKVALKKIEQIKKMSKGGDFRLQCIPGGAFNIAEMKKILKVENLKDGFIPDLIVIDYMDIMAPEPDAPRGDQRHSINHTWQTTADATKELNCCILGATQGSRATISKDMAQDDTAEDIRKLAHVSRMIGINKGHNKGDEVSGESEESIRVKKKHSFRFNKLVERHGKSDEDEKVRVIHALEINKPYLNSHFIEEEVYDE